MKKLDSISPANSCFIALGFLGKSWACMIATGDRERSDVMRCAIGRNWFAKGGKKDLPRKPDADCLGR